MEDRWRNCAFGCDGQGYRAVFDLACVSRPSWRRRLVGTLRPRAVMLECPYRHEFAACIRPHRTCNRAASAIQLDKPSFGVERELQSITAPVALDHTRCWLRDGGLKCWDQRRESRSANKTSYQRSHI